ncbi:MAG: hypothetical protein AAB864_01680 [Patescibacteria group bacterium]
MFNSATQALLRKEQEQRERKEQEIADWLLHGGGGFEGGLDGARAVSFTFAGAVDLLAAYEEYLCERIEKEADRLYTAMEVPGVVPTEIRRILRRVQESGK